jgi:peptidoglycan biosynthesis protein MviN/MurJ (putative lipid II flippase)
MDLMHVEQPLTGSVWAISVLAFWLIVAAIPLASVGLVLSALTRRYGYEWQSGWGLMFQAGFVVQLCSLVTTVTMWLMLLDLPWLLEGTRWSAAAVTLVLSVSIVGGCFALGAWRGLMAAALPSRPRPSWLGRNP